MWTCDKCNRPVDNREDAVNLTFLKQHGNWPTPESKLLYGARHLFPCGDCPGSPSRAQYLKGQPKDSRYPYVKSEEQAWREAYKLMQGGSDEDKPDD